MGMLSNSKCMNTSNVYTNPGLIRERLIWFMPRFNRKFFFCNLQLGMLSDQKGERKAFPGRYVQGKYCCSNFWLSLQCIEKTVKILCIYLLLVINVYFYQAILHSLSNTQTCLWSWPLYLCQTHYLYLLTQLCDIHWWKTGNYNYLYIFRDGSNDSHPLHLDLKCVIFEPKQFDSYSNRPTFERIYS